MKGLVSRGLACLVLLLLAACADTSPFHDPAFPKAPNYETFIRQHLQLTEGKILAHFPGLLDCKVEAQLTGYTPDEMKDLDAWAQSEGNVPLITIMNIDKARKARDPGPQFVAQHPECANIKAQPGTFTDGGDFVVKTFLNREEPLFNKHDVDQELRQATAECYWKVLQGQLSESDRRRLDNVAQGDAPFSALPAEHVTRDQMVMACSKTMVQIEIDTTDYIYYRERY